MTIPSIKERRPLKVTEGLTHDLRTAYQIGDEIYVLYQGGVAEKGGTVQVIEQPRHPYVQLLIDSIPVPDPNERWGSAVELLSEAEQAGPGHSGCRFYSRCPQRMQRCLEQPPPLYQVDQRSHQAACYLYDYEENVSCS